MSRVHLWIFLLASVVALVQVEIVSGQYETPNNLCGGLLRGSYGSIDFVYNNITYTPVVDKNRTCVWTIVPTTLFRRYTVTLESNSMSCIRNNLAVTSFKENSITISPSVNLCNPGETFISDGPIFTVVLISQLPDNDDKKGFKLSWKPIQGDTPIVNDPVRYVTAFNTYGTVSQEPVPYFAGGFMGNSLATWAFPKANGTTEGYTLQMLFSIISLNTVECPDKEKYPDCEFFMICKINGDASITTDQVFYNGTVTSLAPIRNKYGFYFIAWGGNWYSAAGGGRFQLTYNHVRE